MRAAEEKVVVIGAGGHGSEFHSYINDLVREGWRGQFLGFVDDTKPKGLEGRMEVIGSLAEFAAQPADSLREICYLVAVGDNDKRRRLVRKIEESCGEPVRPWTLIHPSA